MFLDKYKATKDAVVLINADPENVRVYLKSTRGIMVVSHPGERLDSEADQLIEANQWPTIKFKFANLEAWGNELPLTDVGTDSNFDFPWQEDRSAPVGVLATLLSKADCEIRNITPIALTPVMMRKPDSEHKTKALAEVMGLSYEEALSRFAANKNSQIQKAKAEAGYEQSPLGLVLKGLDEKVATLTTRTQGLLDNANESRDSRQFMNAGGGQTPAIAMAASELAFLDQCRSNAVAIDHMVVNGDLSKSQGLAKLTSNVLELESSYRKESLKAGTDIDISAIEYYGNHVRRELVPASRQADQSRDVVRSKAREQVFVM